MAVPNSCSIPRLRNDEDKADDRYISQAFVASVGQEIAFEVIGHSTWIAGQALVADRFCHGRAVLAGDAVPPVHADRRIRHEHRGRRRGEPRWEARRAGAGLGRAAADRKLCGRAAADCAAQYRRRQAARRAMRALFRSRTRSRTIHRPGRRRAGPRANFCASFGEEFGSLGIQLGARYDASPIVAGDGAALPSDDPIVYTPSSVPGGRAPHLWLADGSSLFDQLGPAIQFRSFRADPATAALEHAAKTAASRSIP